MFLFVQAIRNLRWGHSFSLSVCKGTKKNVNTNDFGSFFFKKRKGGTRKACHRRAKRQRIPLFDNCVLQFRVSSVIAFPVSRGWPPLHPFPSCLLPFSTPVPLPAFPLRNSLLPLAVVAILNSFYELYNSYHELYKPKYESYNP